jgi:2-oxoglutarate ferredoxin oxidoreductase subunit beta
VRGECYGFVEVPSICPTNWGLSPRESSSWLEKAMVPYYPLGIKKRPDEITGGAHGHN